MKKCFLFIFSIVLISNCRTDQESHTKRKLYYAGAAVGTFGAFVGFYWLLKQFLTKKPVSSNNGLKQNTSSIIHIEKSDAIATCHHKDTASIDTIKASKLVEKKEKFFHGKYQFLSVDQYMGLLHSQYYSELKILFIGAYCGHDNYKPHNKEEKWNEFMEAKQKILAEDLEKLKHPLENHECDGWSEAFISNVEKVFLQTDIAPKAVHYKTSKNGENGLLFVQKNGLNEYELHANPLDINGSTWGKDVYDCDILHELSHIIEGHPVEFELFEKLQFFMFDIDKRSKLKEAIADRRLCSIKEIFLADRLKNMIVDENLSKTFYIGFSKRRIPQFQLMIHLLDAWWLLYEKPSDCGRKLIDRYPQYENKFKPFFSKENIKDLLQTDDSTWDVKRIRTVDYPPKFIDNK